MNVLLEVFMASKNPAKKPLKKRATADLENFRDSVNFLRMKIRKLRKGIKRKSNLNPLWRI